MAVLAAGAIPVIVDVDESITIDPDAIEDAIGPRTRAVIPVHMWGAACAMDRIMAVAGRTTCWCSRTPARAIGGGYEGRKLGTIGHAGAFSFNYYKNMTAGEGGAVCTADDADRRAGQVRDRPLPLLLAGPRATSRSRSPAMVRAPRRSWARC